MKLLAKAVWSTVVIIAIAYPIPASSTDIDELFSELGDLESKLRSIDRSLFAMVEAIEPVENGSGPNFRGPMWKVLEEFVGVELQVFEENIAKEEDYASQKLDDLWERLVKSREFATQSAASEGTNETSSDPSVTSGPRFCRTGVLALGPAKASGANQEGSQKSLALVGTRKLQVAFSEGLADARLWYAAGKKSQGNGLAQMESWRTEASSSIEKFAQPLVNDMDHVKAARDKVASLLNGQIRVDVEGILVDADDTPEVLLTLHEEVFAEVVALLTSLEEQLEATKQEMDEQLPSPSDAVPVQTSSRESGGTPCTPNILGNWLQTKEPKKIGPVPCGHGFILKHQGKNGQAAITQLRGLYRQFAPRLSEQTKANRPGVANRIQQLRSVGVSNSAGRCHPPLYTVVTGTIEDRMVKLELSGNPIPIELKVEGDLSALVFLVEHDAEGDAAAPLASFVKVGQRVCDWTVPTLADDASEADKSAVEMLKKLRESYQCES